MNIIIDLPLSLPMLIASIIVCIIISVVPVFLARAIVPYFDDRMTVMSLICGGVFIVVLILWYFIQP